MQTNCLKKVVMGLIVISLLSGGVVIDALADCIGTNCVCTVSTVGVNFGNYSVFSATHVDSVGEIQVSCMVTMVGLNVAYEIELNGGLHNKYHPRHLINGSNVLEYNLYTNPARTVYWGNGSGSTTKVTDSYHLPAALSEVRHYIVYGRIPGAQNVPPGIYHDSVTVTVNY